MANEIIKGMGFHHIGLKVADFAKSRAMYNALGMKEICGAISGAIAVIGMNNSSGNPERGVTKGSTYELTSALGKKFEEKNGSMLCGELRGGPDKAPLRSCGGCIEDACVLVEEYLKEHYHGV